MKIKEITINNYRAFYGEYTIDLGDGNNAMFYGENGSGKSSLYKALATFFQAADDKVKIEENIFVPTAEKKTALIKLKLVSGSPPIENEVILDFPDKKITSAIQATISDANKARGFLEYRTLLRTHLNHKGKVNLFEFFMEDVLADFRNRFTRISTFKKIWGVIKYKTFEKRQGKNVVKNIKDYIEIYNKGVKQLLSIIEAYTNAFLKYFVEDIDIKLSFAGITYHGRRDLRNKEVQLEVKFHGKSIPIHQEFLNEARLSALAISIYLAALKANPTNHVLKLLFLDDIFIGLDMSNRIPLLRILKDHFADYQVFITTYDRYWYQLAKKWLKNHQVPNWQFFEMYSDVTSHSFSKPHIIPTKDYLLKAKDYLHKKDFAACALYLRRDCEQELQRILPNYLKQEVKKDNTSANLGTKLKLLNDMINNLSTFCEEYEIDDLPFRSLGSLKDSMLNPLAHYDIESPLYRSDLIKIIGIIEELKKIDFTNPNRLYRRGDRLKFRLNKDEGIYREIGITLADACNFVTNNQTGNSYLLKNCNCNITFIDDNGTEVSPAPLISCKSIQEAYLHQCNDFGVEPDIENIETIIYHERDEVVTTIQDKINIRLGI